MSDARDITFCNDLWDPLLKELGIDPDRSRSLDIHIRTSVDEVATIEYTAELLMEDGQIETVTKLIAGVKQADKLDS